MEIFKGNCILWIGIDVIDAYTQINWKKSLIFGSIDFESSIREIVKRNVKKKMCKYNYSGNYILNLFLKN